MDDHVAAVEQDPLALGQAFDADLLDAEFGELLVQVLGMALSCRELRPVAITM